MKDLFNMCADGKQSIRKIIPRSEKELREDAKRLEEKQKVLFHGGDAQ